MRHPPNETPNMPFPERKKTKRIEAHTDAELDAAVNTAVAKFGEDFWIMLHGIDAYMHRRERRDANRDAADHEAAIADLADPWGNS